MDDSDSVVPHPPELITTKPTEDKIVAVKTPQPPASITSVALISSVKTPSPIIKKIGIIKPQDGASSKIDLKLLMDHKEINTINIISSEKKPSKSFIIKNFTKDLKVTTSKTPTSIIVSQAQAFTAGNRQIKLQFDKPVVITKTLDKMSKEKLLSASKDKTNKLSPKSFMNEGSIKLALKPQTVQISKEFDSLINDKNVKINFDKLEKISKEEFEAGNIKKKVEKLEKISKEEFGAGTSTKSKSFEGFMKLKKSTLSKLINPIQIVNGRSTINQKKSLIKLIPSTKTSPENVRIRNFDNLCPVTPPKLIVNNRFIDELKTSPRLSSRSQSVDSSSGKIEKTAKRRLSQPINLNDQENLDAKLIHENKEEIESLLCSENLDNISEENKNLESTSMDLSNFDKFGYRNDVDFFNQVKWINGVTYLNKSNLHFRYNELGLVDLIEEKHAQKLNLTKLEVSELIKPLHKRDGYEKRSTTATLVCKVCSSNGSTHEFLSKTICSIECMNYLEGQQIEANKSLNVKSPAETILGKASKSDEQPRQPYLHSSFTWDSYLAASGGVAAPLNLFKNPYPTTENLFEIGMKVEAIDPLNASKFCVCTVVMIQGYRLKLSFDGYSVDYDFWVNADSMDIFPPGWCDRTNRKLIPPPICKLQFNWINYFAMTKTVAAPESNFKHLKDVSHKNPFKIGMKLEADDLKNSGRITVATVDDVLDNRILVSFDGYSKEFSYWTDISAPYIHPVNWHKQCGFSIIAPPNIKNFSWNEYLAEFPALVAPPELFICRKTIAFEPGMHLEVVDRKLPCLIRPAIVLQSLENGLKIVYDGWPESYNYWLPDDSPDLHPINWCRKTNHALEYPANWQSFYKNACKNDGCRGIGHANRKHITKHFTAMDCPYEYSNWAQEVIVPPRFNNSNASVIEPRELKVFKKRKASSSVVIKQQKPEPLQIEIMPLHKLKSEPTTPTESEPATKKQKPNPEPEKPTSSETELEKVLSVSKRYLSDYGPRLIQSHELWTENSKILRNSKNDVLDRNPLVWSVEEVVEYISYIPSCQDSCKMFRENAIDGSAFLCLTKDDIENVMKVKVGQSIKIVSEINHLRQEVILRFKI